MQLSCISWASVGIWVQKLLHAYLQCTGSSYLPRAVDGDRLALGNPLESGIPPSEGWRRSPGVQEQWREKALERGLLARLGCD